MEEIKSTQHNQLTHFLVDPQKKVYRHLLLIFCVIILSLNGSFLTYPSDPDIALVNSIGSFVFYLIALYLNYYVLIPRFLITNRLLIYVICLVTVILFLVFAGLISEYLLKSKYEIEWGRYALFSGKWYLLVLEILASCFVFGICFAGFTMTFLLQYWFTSGQRITELEKAAIKTELKQLKDQIQPDFLFNIIQTAGSRTRKMPHETSYILMKLSKLLRYQLYDSKRNDVFLDTEIKSIEYYLDLENKRRESAEYSYVIKKDGDIHRAIVPPLLFISFVKYHLSHIDENQAAVCIELDFKIAEKQLNFSCQCPVSKKVDNQDELLHVRRRLDLLFGKNYSLDVYENQDSLRTLLIFELQ
ncbi:MAG: histidine kinase [Tannerella sp.]|jgi:hypothetical protein|nr:histidine kinase [Tannerella sp.]